MNWTVLSLLLMDQVAEIVLLDVVKTQIERNQIMGSTTVSVLKGTRRTYWGFAR
jgi:hypothetical protein